MRHPIQPIVEFDNGMRNPGRHLRFKGNEIVKLLLDEGPFDMNTLARRGFTNEDRQQFAQLIGYSLSGYGELPYVDDAAYAAAQACVGSEKSEQELRIEYLEDQIRELRDDLRVAMARLFESQEREL